MTMHVGAVSSTVGARASGLDIAVSGGVGTGATALAAFDAALREAGVADFNLIHISSVIPAGSVVSVKQGHGERVAGAWGDRLYVVMADCRTQAHNEEAWAGIGWVQEEVMGRGLFVEHVGHSRLQVEADLDASLEAMVRGRPNLSFGNRRSVIRGITCHDEPVCALVAAAYRSAGWSSGRVIELP